LCAAPLTPAPVRAALPAPVRAALLTPAPVRAARAPNGATPPLG